MAATTAGIKAFVVNTSLPLQYLSQAKAELNNRLSDGRTFYSLAVCGITDIHIKLLKLPRETMFPQLQSEVPVKK